MHSFVCQTSFIFSQFMAKVAEFFLGFFSTHENSLFFPCHQLVFYIFKIYLAKLIFISAPVRYFPFILSFREFSSTQVHGGWQTFEAKTKQMRHCAC